MLERNRLRGGCGARKEKKTEMHHKRESGMSIRRKKNCVFGHLCSLTFGDALAIVAREGSLNDLFWTSKNPKKD